MATAAFLWSAAATTAAPQFLSPPGRGTAAAVPPVKCHFGVNLCGTEFPSKSVPTTAELDYYRSRGIYTFRLPLHWEFLQPALMR
jgi:hypothetical protein